jgi:hypothetical protein
MRLTVYCAGHRTASVVLSPMFYVDEAFIGCAGIVRHLQKIPDLLLW